MSDGSLVPLLAAAGAIVVAGLAAAVAVVVEEEEVDRLSLAAEAITNSVLALRKRQRPYNLDMWRTVLYVIQLVEIVLYRKCVLYKSQISYS